MEREILKSKIHRATVTAVNIQYEGSLTLDGNLMQSAKICPYEKIEIYNIDNGQRFSTYVLPGKPGEVCINGAAARLAVPGDLVILATYVRLSEAELEQHTPIILHVNERNEIRKTRSVHRV